MEDVKKIKIELVTKKLFGDLEIECYVDTSVENGNFFMTRRQIGEALEYKSLNSFHKIIQRNSDVIGEAMTVDLQSTMINKIYTTELYSIDQVLKILSYTCKPNSKILINELCKIKGYAPIKIKSRYEIDFENVLFTTFKDILFIERQYNIKGYFLDWYIPQYNIIIECDENNHNNYNKDEEKNRIDYINKKLNTPIWIRFNPNEGTFNVGNVLNEILKNIVGFRMKSTS